MGRVGRPPSCTCGKCFKCKRAAYMREWWNNHTLEQKREKLAGRDVERVRQHDHDRYHNDPERRAYVHERATEWRKQNPDKKRAHYAVSNALRDGRLTRGDCEQEGDDCSGPIHGHHEDYTKPLQVRWLCASHHARLHVGVSA